MPPRTPDADWRPDPERHLSLLFDVFALGQRVRSLVSTAMAGSGLRPDEYAAYSVVFESDGITMSAMARELGMPVTTAADYVRAMQARGHLRRDTHPTDSRSYVLALTPDGRRAHRKASAAFQRAHQALLVAIAPRDEDSLRGVVQVLSAGAAAATEAISRPSRRRGAPVAP
jgi:DNA-binding MarR family transcriptional regulator